MILKAPDEPAVAEAVDALVAAGIPVVTYTTDVPASARCGYVGIDNHAAGATAAYLIRQWLGGDPAHVDHVEQQRLPGRGRTRGGIRSALRGSNIGVVDVTDSDGIDATNEGLVLDALRRHPRVVGSTRRVAARRDGRGIRKLDRRCRVFVAHDLDVDNRRLLREGRLSVVLHNDLRSDARLGLRLILQQRGALPPSRSVPCRSKSSPRTTFPAENVTLSGRSAGRPQTYRQ